MFPSILPRCDQPAVIIIGVVTALFTTAVAQDSQGQREAQNRQIYQQLYNAAMLDSVISDDEKMQLQTLQQALGLNDDIMESILESPALPLEPRLDQSGRWTLMVQNMIWGSTIYGVGIPVVLELEDFKWYIGGFMFGLGGGLITTWNYTSGLHFPEARSQLQRAGGGIGLHYGVALAQLIDVEARGGMMISMAAVPAGIYVGDRIFKKWDPTTGMAYAMGTHAELGRAFGTTLHRQILPPPVEPPYPTGNYYTYNEQMQTYYFDEEAYNADHKKYDSDLENYNKKIKPWRNVRNLFQVAGYPAGFYLGQRYFGQRDYSFGDAFLLIVGRWGGALYGLMIADLLDMDFGEQATGWRWTVMAAGMTGMVGMDRWIKGYNYSFGQSFLMSLGAVAGAGFTTGLGLIMEVDDLKFYEFTGMAAALGGMAWVKSIINPGREYTSAGSQAGPRVQFSLLPMVTPTQLVPALELQLRW